MKKRLEVNISGRVQMIMFRDFAKRKADSLGLTGTAENLNDGSVFVVAEGEEEKLQKFLGYLKKGPLFARVERIDENWLSFAGEFNDFKIILYNRR